MMEKELLDSRGQGKAFRQRRLPRKRRSITRYLFIALVLAVILLAGTAAAVVLYSDRVEKAPPAATESQRTETAAEEANADPSPEEPRRGKKRTIRYVNADNTEIILDTKLFIGDGYSIDIPLTNWSHEATTYGGNAADRWVCQENENAWLMVTKIDGGEERAKQIVRQTESHCGFFEDRQGNFYAQQGEQVTNVRFIRSEAETFAVMESYPMNVYEGPGRQLAVLADTFDCRPRETETQYPGER